MFFDSTIPATLPLLITKILSVTPNNYGISEDTIIIPMPSLAKSFINLYISYLAPTSIPLVGSSNIKIFGLVNNQRPIITFC